MLVRKPLVGLLLGLAGAALAALVGLSPFARTVELKTYDWRMRVVARPELARRDIVLVAIDEDSVEKLAPVVGRWPWPRMVHAQLIDYLARGHARTIVYDVLFTEPDRAIHQIGDGRWSGEESDRVLVDAVRQSGNVIVAADASVLPGATNERPAAIDQGYRVEAAIEQRPAIRLPFAGLAQAARSIGHTLFVLDPDGPVRHTVPLVRVGGSVVPSLAVAGAVEATRTPPSDVRVTGTSLQFRDRALQLLPVRIPDFYGKPRPGLRALVNFRGPVLSAAGRTTYAEYSFFKLFYAEQQLVEGQAPLVDPAVFKDKIVVVGTTAPGLYDTFPTPFPGKMAGMQVHATIIDNLLSSGFVRPAPAWAAFVALVVPAVVLGLLSMVLSVWWSIAAAVLLACGFTVGSHVLFARGDWIELTQPVLALAFTTFGGVAYQYFVEGREKRRIKHVFSRLVARDVYNHLLEDPSRVELGGLRRPMTVLFSDIRGFTTLTEREEPEAIVLQLNEYFTRMVDVLFTCRGTLDKFVGDAVMALFGAPLDDPDHAEHAVQAALAMSAALDALNREWSSRGRPAFDIGIGINTGEMVAGIIGSAQVMSYTVIGDAVNLASRLESLNKQYQTRVIISENTRSCLKGQYDIRPLGHVTVKGKSQPVEIFEVRAAPIDGSSERSKGQHHLIAEEDVS